MPAIRLFRLFIEQMLANKIGSQTLYHLAPLKYNLLERFGDADMYIVM